MSPDKATAEPAEPWRSFLRELDACLTGQVELRCFGGFVVAQHYGLGRETSDIDFVAATALSPTRWNRHTSIRLCATLDPHVPKGPLDTTQALPVGCNRSGA